MARKKKNDPWIEAAIGIGIGALAIYFLKKLSDKPASQQEKKCPYCGMVAGKWARSCSNCRNTFPL